MALSANDPTSYSNPELAVVSHIDLNLDVDFTQHILQGSVNLTVTKLDEAADHVILDSKGLKINGVLDKNSSQQLQYTLGEPSNVFGSKLQIQLPNTADKKCEITINYETAPDCSALQWLKPSQTAGKKLPYMFSQCQAIHCRSLIPCQDTPSVKCPYTAKITAPKDIKMLMSAKLVSTSDCQGDGGKACYSFEQPVPMPSYLIAIVGGDLVSRDIGPRSKVWSEPTFVDQAAHEFAQTEAMLVAAEELLGPYVWGHYDLLVLPPSFPYGGMENPCLTFVTPTLLAGDQSLADVVAHEISHSWTGNLVTNKTFEDFWLNEGNTVFVETKIVCRMNGGEKYRHFLAAASWRVLEETVRPNMRLNEGNTVNVERKIVSRLNGGEKYRHFLAASGWEKLAETVKVLSEDYNQPEYTKLVPKMDGVDPDDAFSSVPYEKGHAFLFYLETLLGGPEVFDPFLKAYIDKFKYKSITTNDWKDFLLSYFQEQGTAGKLDSVDWDTWLYGEGMPPVKPEYDVSLAEVCQQLADRWLSCSDDDLVQFSNDDIQKFRPQQTMTFLVMLLNKAALSHAKIKAMGDTYNFNTVKNSEIRFRWLRVCIKAQYSDIIPAALDFVTQQGRMKFVEPVYKDLYNWEGARDTAVQNFQANKDSMHSTSVAAVAKAMKMEP